MINELIIHIAGFLEDKQAVKLLALDRNLYTEAQYDLHIRKMKKLLSFFPAVLRPLIYGLKRLEIGQKVGSTHYIDFIRAADMSEDIMVGRDVFRRGFISLKHDRGVLTFFQRYTDDINYYTTGGKYPEGIDGCGGFRFAQDEVQRLRNDTRICYLLDRLSYLSR